MTKKSKSFCGKAVNQNKINFIRIIWQVVISKFISKLQKYAEINSKIIEAL